MRREAQENGFRLGGQAKSNALLLQNHRVGFTEPSCCFLETNALVFCRDTQRSLFLCGTPPLKLLFKHHKEAEDE